MVGRYKVQKSLYLYYQMPMATKLGRIVTYFERLLTIKSFYTLITWSCKVMWQTKIIIYHNQSAYGYKLGRMITYLDEFLHIKLHHSLIMWSCKVTWQTKTIISLLQKSLWQPNLAEWWLPLTSSYICHMTLWSRGLVRYEFHLQEGVQHANT